MVQDERHFAFLGEALSGVKGFKIASCESLFCDFAYRELAELKGIFAFRYCLVRADENEFKATFSEEKNEKSLFDTQAKTAPQKPKKSKKIDESEKSLF